MPHTPTPWAEPEYENSDVSDASWYVIPEVGTFYDKADADLARKAVNSHDRLVDALRMVADSGKFSCFDDAAWDAVNSALEGL